MTETVFHFLGEPVSWAELLGFVTGIACVALAVARRIENVPVGIVNNVFFLVLFADARLFADALLQVIYLVLGVMGWWAWLRLGPRRGALRVGTASPALLAWTAVGVAAGTLALVPVLRAADDSAPAARA